MNIATREQLAGYLADQLDEVDLAMDQIKCLMEMPGQLPARNAEWLALMSAWEIRRGTNPEAARDLLRRLIREHPKSVQAFAAQQRLSLLEAEARASRTTSPEGATPARDHPG